MWKMVQFEVTTETEYLVVSMLFFSCSFYYSLCRLGVIEISQFQNILISRNYPKMTWSSNPILWIPNLWNCTWGTTGYEYGIHEKSKQTDYQCKHDALKHWYTALQINSFCWQKVHHQFQCWIQHRIRYATSNINGNILIILPHILF